MVYSSYMDRGSFQYQKREYWTFYCPVCKIERRSVYWPSPRKRHYVQLAVFALFSTLCLWPFTGFKGFFLNFVVWGLFEFFYRARARQSLICPHCGFDPYLYKFDVKLARARMDEFWAAKKPAEKPEAAKADGEKPAQTSDKKPG